MKIFRRRIRRGVANPKELVTIIPAIIVFLLLIFIVNAFNSAVPQPSNPQLSSAYNNTISNIEFAFGIADIGHIIMFFIIVIILIAALIHMIRK